MDVAYCIEILTVALDLGQVYEKDFLFIMKDMEYTKLLLQTVLLGQIMNDSANTSSLACLSLNVVMSSQGITMNYAFNFALKSIATQRTKMKGTTDCSEK